MYRALEDVVLAGRARAIGVSNFNASAIDMLYSAGLRVPPAVDQCGFSIGGHNASRWGRDDATVAACHKAGVQYSAYSPLGGWTGTDVLHHPTVLRVAAVHKRSAAQVALRWVVQQSIPAVTSAKVESYATEDLDIFSFALSSAEMAELSAV